MKKRIVLIFLLLIFLLSAFVYWKSHESHLANQEGDTFTLATYLIGYAMTEICVGIAIFEMATDRKHNMSLWAAFICMALRLAFDLLTVLSDGFALSGLFQMDVFLVLDLMILSCDLIVIRKGSRPANALLAVITAVYLFGEVAGYPVRTFDDMDEFVLMFSILAVAVMPLISPKEFRTGLPESTP